MKSKKKKQVVFVAHVDVEDAQIFDQKAKENCRSRKKHLEYMIDLWVSQFKGVNKNYTF
jgi:hypothetical protein